VRAFLCFIDRASLYNLVNKANLVHNLFLVYLFFVYYVYQLINVIRIEYTKNKLCIILALFKDSVRG